MHIDSALAHLWLVLLQVDAGRVVHAINSLPVPTDFVDPVTQAWLAWNHCIACLPVAAMLCSIPAA
jgi:hypothetical protein